jgi:predicted NUDIX family phosphoesterase
LVVPADNVDFLLTRRARAQRNLGPFPLSQILSSLDFSFKPRSLMENDPSFKQVIPYVVIKWDRSDHGMDIFCYTRGSGQGEKRLHAKCSIGIGGHINDEDISNGAHPYIRGMWRELNEELDIAPDNIVSLEYKDFIYDPSDEVGKVHLGLVHVLTVSSKDIKPREDTMHDYGFVEIGSMLSGALTPKLENWTKIALQII